LSKTTLLPNKVGGNQIQIIIILTVIFFADEFKGHCLLESCRQADVARLKKYLSSDSVTFKHPYTGDTALHCAAASPYAKRKQVS